MSLALLRAALAKIPGIAWVIAFAAVLLAALWFCGVHIGERRGEVKVQRQAVADSVVHVRAEQHEARARSDSVIRVAKKAKVASDTGRAATRAVIAAHLTDTPPDVVQAVNRQLERDSVTIALHVAAVDTVLVERPIADRLDSLRVETIDVGQPEPDHHTVAKIAGGVVVGVVGVLTLIHFAR